MAASVDQNSMMFSGVGGAHNLLRNSSAKAKNWITFLISTTQYLYYFQSVSNVKEYSRKINESLQKTLVFMELIVAPLIPNIGNDK